MDLERLIAELYAERARLTAAIQALEKAIAAGHKRRQRAHHRPILLHSKAEKPKAEPEIREEVS